MTIIDALAGLATPLDALRTLPGNPRRGDVEAVMRSYRRFGQRKPIVATRDGTVIAGNHQLEAARRLGWDDIAVVYTDDDELTAKAFALADNRTAEKGYYDEADLLALMESVSVDPELLVDTAWTEDDLAELVAKTKPKPALTDPDEVPDVPAQPVTVPGDIWLLGPHRLLCGDATVPTDVDKLMAGAKAEMVFTDPPYGVGYDGGTKVREKLAGDESTNLYGPACFAAAAASTPTAPLYLWHAGVKGIAAAAAAAAIAAGYEIRCELVWNKNQAQFGALGAQYKQKHEPCYYCHKKGHAPNWSGPTNEVTVWDVDRANVNAFHPTQKPVALAVRALNNHTARSVLDLFAGSGSTLIAAHQTGRVAYLLELDPGYCDVICRRYQEHTGEKPVNEATGEPRDFTAGG